MERKIGTSIKVEETSRVYKDVVEPRLMSRTLSEFITRILEVYSENEELRKRIDKELEKKDPLKKIETHIEKVSIEGERLSITTKVLNDIVDIKRVRDTRLSEVKEVFDKDSVLESLKLLLPKEVLDGVEEKIEERVEVISEKLLKEGKREVKSNVELEEVKIKEEEEVEIIKEGLEREKIKEEKIEHKEEVKQESIKVEEPSSVVKEEKIEYVVYEGLDSKEKEVIENSISGIVEEEKKVEVKGTPNAFNKLMKGLRG